MGSPFKLILLRHGQSVYNREQRFTGWTDVPLSPQGEAEAARAGRLLRAGGLDFDIAFSSLLKRAIETLEIVSEEMGLEWVPRVMAWELNERHYGSLQGKTKDEVAAQVGSDQVRLWRRGFSQRPPTLDYDDPRHPRFDRRYRFLPPERLPSAESLADVSDRVVPFWEEKIGPEIRSGRRVLVVSHGNALRALVKYLEGICDDDISKVEIPTGVPIVYDLDSDLCPRSRRILSDKEP
ncbi:2,3-diphosphoglycerate-dependent phosphoglycerate mutase [Methanotrichaceae archaeon M04Ac]|uniref:2,3-bisphosphoglycerate-dependent phosphoglycerate mutase n=1 Tax=Candidatus Methanocrinis alkalitolerans TaxID=3033395 RepID=A0ABT5XGQ3_9EURY|nr:2,3-diphosphoglycerate-dependent phosphoglycerate mutase [Candidatus Methanocrinis alkalitolerans]MCR3884938.1 2,3-diphosphoglycerate-dependent phosphoglycerate mutase [Methanothrix sp.]MDF0593845.1 2,3-diphosphoglycerate-dependent phosphoglycerate mutase [Candidatus Methanocrinis alkalitolerans]